MTKVRVTRTGVNRTITADPKTKNNLSMQIVGTNKVLTLPYSPRNGDMSNLADSYEQINRSGRTALVVRSGTPADSLSYELFLGYRDKMRTIETLRARLLECARARKLQLKYTSWESGYWHIQDLSISITQRHPINHEPTRALAQITLVRAGSQVAGHGPLSGGHGEGTGGHNPNWDKWRTYKVKAGDTLHSISIKMYDTPKKWTLIAKANKITDPRPGEKGEDPRKKMKLKVGRELKIPPKDSDLNTGGGNGDDKPNPP